ncbi:MAG: transcriptional repressor NrdR [Clostridia bacterium]|nr:transcriptional repressor NrdR [Clostridia bacterium]
MKCPHCGFEESKVIDSRPVEENSSIKRRRECLNCQSRFTTFEMVETIQPMVIKKDGSREYFDKSKLQAGIIKACQKRPVNAAQIANKVEANILNALRTEITSTEIGELTMQELRKADPVAYIRFVSVYRDFDDIDTFMQELKKFL